MRDAKALLVAFALSFLSLSDGQAVKTETLASVVNKDTPIEKQYIGRKLQDLALENEVLTEQAAKNRVREVVLKTKNEKLKVRYEASTIKNRYFDMRSKEYNDYRENVSWMRADLDGKLEELKKERELGLISWKTFRQLKTANRAELQETLTELGLKRSVDKMEVLETYVKGLAKLGLMGMKAQSQIAECFAVVDEMETMFDEIKVWCEDQRVKIRHHLKEIVTNERVYSDEMKRIESIMVQNMCFEFWGASGEIPDDQIMAFNDVMKIALQQAFDEEVASVIVFEFELVVQNYIDHEEQGVRRLGGERILGRADNRLLVDALVGLRCNCETARLSSDVVHRGLVEMAKAPIVGLDPDEGFRLLTDTSVMDKFAATVRELANGVFGKLVSVNTLVCSDMEMPGIFK